MLELFMELFDVTELFLFCGCGNRFHSFLLFIFNLKFFSFNYQGCNYFVIQNNLKCMVLQKTVACND